MQVIITTIVDDLILIKSIGKGSYAEVFLSKKIDRPEYYATKKIKRAISERPENMYLLPNEIEILKDLNHPNIVKYCDLKKTENHWYLVTEFVNGGSLLDNLNKYMEQYGRPFPEEIVQFLMKQIVSALNYLHSNKIIHRDLKLENILVNFFSEYDKNSLNMMNCTVKIIDFGFATKLYSDLTFDALGTPTNMDPLILESVKTGIQNTGYNEKADIWSLGILCYQMLVGTTPFSGNSVDELSERVKEGTYSLPLFSSKEFASFISRMLQQDPNNRLTAQELLYHDFLVKDPSQFQPVDANEIQGTLGLGEVANLTSNSQPQFDSKIGLDFCNTLNQPQIYIQDIQEQTQVEHRIEFPVEQLIYVESQPQQEYYIIESFFPQQTIF